MIELLYFMVFILVAFSIGRRLLRLFKLKISFAEELVFGVCLGYFLIGYVAFFLGISGLIYKQLFYVLFLVGLFVSFFDIKYIFKGIKKSYSNFKFGFNLKTTLLFILFFFVVLNLVAVVAPIWRWDVLSYHFAVPKLYIKAHSIYYIFHSMSSNAPFFSQMLYLTAMVLKSPILAKLVSYSFSLIIVLGIISFSKRFFNLYVGLFGALIFFLMPLMMQSSISAGADVATALFCFVSFYAFVVWFKKLDIRWLVLSSVMMGVALSTKYFAGIQFLILSAFLVFRLITIKDKELKYKLACLFLFPLIAFLVFSPWLIKNYLYTGNPVYPLLYSLFGGKYLSQTKAMNLAMSGNAFPANLKNFVLMPWYLTMFSPKVSGVMGVGPVFLAFLPLLLVLKGKKNILLRLLLVFSFFAFTIWFFLGGHYVRFIYFIFPLLAIVCAFVINKLISSKVRLLRTFVLLVLLSTLLFNLNLWAGINLKYVPVVFGFESKEQFHDNLKDHSLYHASQFINENTSPDAKVLLFKDRRGYFINREYVYYNYAYTTYFDGVSDDSALLDELRDLGITHVIMNDNFDTYIATTFYPDEVHESFKNLTIKYAENIYSRKGVEVFELKWEG